MKTSRVTEATISGDREHLTIIWYRDGRPGHERQVQALLQALEKHRRLTVHSVRIAARPSLIGGLFGGLFSGRRFPAPRTDTTARLILGCGHRTHLPVLAAGRRSGASTAILMQPSLPTGWFDCCIVPRHDRSAGRAGVITTIGPLSPVQPLPASQRRQHGVILVGGPSRHWGWSAEQVWHSVEQLVSQSSRSWQLLMSPRTPTDFAAGRPAGLSERLNILPWAGPDSPDVDQRVASAAACWVTADSLSMLFDGLTAGVPCGVIGAARLKRGRVRSAVGQLLADGWISETPSRPAEYPPPALREADRAARQLLDRLAL